MPTRERSETVASAIADVDGCGRECSGSCGFRLETDRNSFSNTKSWLKKYGIITQSPPQAALLDILEVRDQENLPQEIGGN